MQARHTAKDLCRIKLLRDHHMPATMENIPLQSQPLEATEESSSNHIARSPPCKRLSYDQQNGVPRDYLPYTCGDSDSESLRILVAPTGFKEALGPEAVAVALEEGLRRVIDEDKATIVKLPLHDGGEGFCKALVAHYGGEIRELVVTGPVGEPVSSYFGLIGEAKKIAVLDSKSDLRALFLRLFHKYFHSSMGRLLNPRLTCIPHRIVANNC